MSTYAFFTSPSNKPQHQVAQAMYAARAPSYDHSWHPAYTQRLLQLFSVSPINRILSLCCGTGLEISALLPTLTSPGHIVGIDATEEMLAIARGKPDIAGSPHVTLLRHDVSDLSSCPDVTPGSFDVIVCSNAFVLLDNPSDVVAHWATYLKQGGTLVVDIPHEHNFRSGTILEKVTKRLGGTFPSDRAWIESKESFRVMLEANGYVVEKIEELSKEEGRDYTYYGVEEADEQFEYITRVPLGEHLATEEFKTKARPLFREEWERAAVDGKVQNCELLYVYVARKL